VNDDVPAVKNGSGSRPALVRVASQRSLPALLDECLDEVLGVLLQHVVDLVEQGVHVVGEGVRAAPELTVVRGGPLGGGLVYLLGRTLACDFPLLSLVAIGTS